MYKKEEEVFFFINFWFSEKAHYLKLQRKNIN